MKIQRLNIKNLQLSESIYDHYKRNYSFVYASHKDGKFENIPVLEKTSHYLSNCQKEIPKEYFSGFYDEYVSQYQIDKKKPEETFKLIEKIRDQLFKNIPAEPEFIINDLNAYNLGIKTAKAFKAWQIIILEPNIFEKYFKPKKLKKQPQTFESLFNKPKAAKEFYDRFIELEYYQNGKWKGISGKSSELLAAYCVLKDKNILTPVEDIPQVKAFYNEFGLKVEKKGGDITESMVGKVLRGEILLNTDKDRFKKSFRELLNKYSS